MSFIYLGLGSNLGDKEANIRKAIELIGQKCKVLRVSRLYKTEPVGYKEQDWFLNCVVEAESCCEPLLLFAALQAIEKRLKREKTVVNGPRTIDIDVLFWGDSVLNVGGFTIPHPKLHERGFVLQPLMELAPNLVHPVQKKTVKQLIEALKGAEKVELCE
ncbi:MAG: 2-amino-4-hydroxy-6-hydroxymethyldihydropteridine diphosphokinase [Candidatus Altiarchaeota archaeon]